MWPLIMQFLRSNAAYITLPVATLVGVIGYNIEGLLSDKYTPYSRKRNFHSREASRGRITEDEKLKVAADVEKLVYKENVLGRNLSPSLENGK